MLKVLRGMSGVSASDHYGLSQHERRLVLHVAVFVRVFLERCLTSGRTEVERLAIMARRELGLLLVHHHTAYWIFLQQHTSFS